MDTMEIQRIKRDYSSSTVVENPPANAGNTGDAGLILGLGRSHENEKAAHSSILAWEVNRGVWWAAIHRSERAGHNLVTKQKQNANNNYSTDNVKFIGKIIDIYEALGREILKFFTN